MMGFKSILVIIIISFLIISCDRVTDPSITTPTTKTTGPYSIEVDTGNGLITGENGPLSDTFTVVLNMQPSSNITIGTITSSDTSEVTVSPASLIFTTSNWNVPQTVTITSVDDAISDNYQIVSISLGTAVGAEYDGLSAGLVYVTNLDDDTTSANVIIVNDGLITKEDPSTPLSDSFQVVLSSAPSANVTISSITSTDTGEATVSPSTLTFTTSNWSTAQTVTVTGVDDAAVDGLQSLLINFTNTTSTDSNWNGLSIGSLTVYNIDDEPVPVPGIDVIAGPLHLTSENGLSSTFNVVLDSQPTANVTISVASSDSTEGVVTTPSGGTLTFTSSNWNIPQSVVVQGQDDSGSDGNIDYTVTLGTASSTDSNYNGIDPADVSCRNIDDDTVGIIVSTGDGLITREDPSTPLSDTLQVVLSTQPSNDVVISGISSSDTGEVTVSPASLTFTTANWNTPQTVTVTGVDDVFVDSTQAVTIDMGTVASSDAAYNGYVINDQTVYNIDDDSLPSVVVIERVGGFETSENGMNTVIPVVLSRQPAADVTLSTITTTDSTEGTVSPGSLTFTASNWNLPHLITVSAVDDTPLADGNIAYTIDLGITSSTDTDFNGLDPGGVTVTNRDFIGIGDYIWASSSGSFASISGSGIPIILSPIDLASFLADDEGVAYVNLGFNFIFLGMPYDFIAVYSNGFASFNMLSYNVNNAINQLLFDRYNDDEFINILAPWWDDMDMDTGTMYYENTGSPGSRIMTIEWNAAHIYGTDDSFTFQLKLYEGSDVIEFIYGPSNNSGADSTTASAGVKEDAHLETIRNYYIEALTGDMGMVDGAYSSYEWTFADYPAEGTVITFTPGW